MRKGIKRAAVALVMAALVSGGWAAERLWPRHLDPSTAPAAPVVTLEGDRLALQAPAAALAAEVGSYSDELPAYLNSQFLWGRVLRQRNGTEVVLSQSASDDEPAYRIYLMLPKDLLTALPFLSTLEDEGYISHYRLLYWSASDLEYQQAGSEVLEASYKLPAPMSFDELGTPELIGPLTHFILFKSRTDWRVRKGIAPVPRPLTVPEARREAQDIIDVARFYNLPLDQFAGIAAQENNYLNADGDLKHAVWKRRAEAGDIVLKRRRRRVLVSDYSMGVWQISRESLRYAHVLYARDYRSYSLLPARLRPSEDFRVDATRPEVLTTYAGLLFRHLIDHFQGNIALALGAYNGGSEDPNADYSASVALAAASARRTVEQSMALDGWQVIPVKIIPYSLPPQAVVRPTLADSLRGDANELVGKIMDRIQRYRSGESSAPDLAENRTQDAGSHGSAGPATDSGSVRPRVSRDGSGIYAAGGGAPGSSQ
ncbi:MAG: hypothetical protein ACRD4R_10555 [Candidatus Acidiferrales bacterium]